MSLKSQQNIVKCNFHVSMHYAYVQENSMHTARSLVLCHCPIVLLSYFIFWFLGNWSGGHDQLTNSYESGTNLRLYLLIVVSYSMAISSETLSKPIDQLAPVIFLLFFCLYVRQRHFTIWMKYIHICFFTTYKHQYI